MNTKETTVYFAASITVEGRSESENIERIQNLLTKWEKELSKGTVALNLAGVPAVAAKKTSKIIIEVADRDTAIGLLGSIEDHLRDYVEEKETAKIIDTRVESEATHFDTVTYDLRDEDIADEVDDGR